MKLNRHDCAVFGIGAAVGGLLAWAGSYIFFRKKLDQWDRAYEDLQKENHEIVKSSEKRINELREANKEFASKIIKHDDIPTQASNTGRDKGVLSRQQRDDIRKKLEKNYEGTTSYARAYVGKDTVDDIEEELAEQEHPEDDEPEIDESYADPREQEHEGDISTTLPESSKEADVDEFFKEHQKKKGRKPRIISVEEAANLPEYIESQTLFYYATNEVMTDEDEEVIEDPKRLIGDALTKYGFADNDEQRIFVMNYQLDTCYEIAKILGSYEVD